MSAKGERLATVGPMGELTEVASAKRAIRGVLVERPSDEQEELRERTVTFACLLASSRMGLSGSLSVGNAEALL